MNTLINFEELSKSDLKDTYIESLKEKKEELLQLKSEEEYIEYSISKLKLPHKTDYETLFLHSMITTVFCLFSYAFIAAMQISTFIDNYLAYIIPILGIVFYTTYSKTEIKKIFNLFSGRKKIKFYNDELKNIKYVIKKKEADYHKQIKMPEFFATIGHEYLNEIYKTPLELSIIEDFIDLVRSDRDAITFLTYSQNRQHFNELLKK